MKTAFVVEGEPLDRSLSGVYVYYTGFSPAPLSSDRVRALWFSTRANAEVRATLFNRSEYAQEYKFKAIEVYV